jgi:hypothetical protein
MDAARSTCRGASPCARLSHSGRERSSPPYRKTLAERVHSRREFGRRVQLGPPALARPGGKIAKPTLGH